MTIALKELWRQPRRFSAVTIALTLLIVLLVVLGGFLDGLESSQTGAYRAHEGDVLVFDDGAERQLQRSRVSTGAIEAIADLDSVEAVGTLDAIFAVAGTASGAPSDGDGRDGELQDVVLFGYDLGTDTVPEPPPPGSAIVDDQLARVSGIAVGDTLEVGPAAEPVTVAAIVDDLTTGAPTVWVRSDEWRRLATSINPGAVPPEGTAQVLVVRPVDGEAAVVDDLGELADRGGLEAGGAGEAADGEGADGGAADGGAAVGGDGLDPVTVDEAIAALDVVQQQSSTFQGIITVTFVITLLVVALFFALITLERTGLYAVLKALGARSGELLLGLSAQAVAISAVALAVGLTISAVFVALLPPELPLRVEAFRLVQVAAGTVVTAILGSLFTARRILRIDPAEAIG